MTRVVMLDPLRPERVERIRPFLPDGWEIGVAASRAPEDQLAALQGADFAVTGDVPVSALMMAVPGLKAVHKWGVGYDNIDCVAAKANGVRVMRTTGSNAIAVAETTLGLILSVSRNIARGHAGVLNGEWLKGTLGQTSFRLTGKTVGIIGLGYIGKALAKLLSGFDSPILYTKRTPLSAEEEAALNARFVPLEELLANSDVVTLNCELNDQTRGIINKHTLALMKPTAVLVNASRGGVVIEEDLAAALREGRLLGAAADVFAMEPIARDNPLLALPNMIMTPHIAAVSTDGFAPSVTRMMTNFKSVADGREPPEMDVVA
ncbi:2-hydroxyacid dehydrogenase [Pseudoruegeria sp. HB172150]|uniref:2-hydroxyacid dehydrogenase n=1 Tax=Pseudoruegeria sp. HB172150 TaxID=2721164 RepID=UPI001C131203|nr:2-hydroxyacid dehydrogenase [Pseudoruegeria sp. HB172150]